MLGPPLEPQPDAIVVYLLAIREVLLDARELPVGEPPPGPDLTTPLVAHFDGMEAKLELMAVPATFRALHGQALDNARDLREVLREPGSIAWVDGNLVFAQRVEGVLQRGAAIWASLADEASRYGIPLTSPRWG